MEEQKINNETIKKAGIDSVLEDSSKLKILLDTSTLKAAIFSKERFHLEAKTSIDALRLKGAWFVLPHIVIGEYIARRGTGGSNISVKSALAELTKFEKWIGQKLVGGPPISLHTIVENYKRHSRHRKLTKSGFMDFLILCTAESMKNIWILTCDKQMKENGSTIFKEKIYYLPSTATDGTKSDYPRLMNDIQNLS